MDQTQVINLRGLLRNCGVMVSMLTSGAVDRGFELWSGQTKKKKLVFIASPLRAIPEKSVSWGQNAHEI